MPLLLLAFGFESLPMLGWLAAAAAPVADPPAYEAKTPGNALGGDGFPHRRGQAAVAADSA